MIAWILAHWHAALAVILGIYEVIARVIPTVKTWSILSWIIKLLSWISDNLDIKKK